MDDEQANSNDPSPEDPLASTEPVDTSPPAKSPWDDLAQTLGAKPSPDALERPRLESAPPHQEPITAAEQPVREPSVPQAPPVQTSATQASDWAGLAGSLGITVEESAERATAAPPADPIDNDTNRSSPAQTSKVAAQKGGEPSFFGAGEAVGADEEQAQVAFAAALDSSTDNQSGAETDDPLQKSLSGEVARNVFDALFLSGAAAAEALSDLLPLKKSSARKQENEGADQRASAESVASVQDETNQDLQARDGTEKNLTERKPRRRRGRGRRRRGQNDRGQDDRVDAAKDGTETNPQDSALEPADISAAESNPQDGPFEEPIDRTPSLQGEPRGAASEESEHSSADSSEESRKSSSRRRRPRRRRGRGRGVATRETDDPTISQEREASSDSEDTDSIAALAQDGVGDSTNAWERAAPQDGLNRRGSPKSAAVDPLDEIDPLDTNEIDETVEADDILNRGSSSKRPSHRNIPTWAEAMSVIVESNLELRKKSPTQPGRSGSSRSRSRGGRRRKNT